MSDEQRGWGKAGLRLTAQQAQTRDVRNRQRSIRRADHAAHVEEIAHRKWLAGMVVPHSISMALDKHDLYGPEVDAACCAREPDVDLWEAGKLYPRWDQLVALGVLTQTPLTRFVECSRSVGLLDTSMRFHIRPHERLANAELRTVTRFPDDVVARCPGTELWQAWHERAGQ